jgi:hypothetical protein
MKETSLLLAILLIGSACVRAFAQTEDFATAVSAGTVSVTFHGTGGSSGDAIQAIIATTPKTSGDLVLTIAPGTRLQSENPSAQNMVIAGVKGQLVSENSYTPTREIMASAVARTYVLDAFCTDFEKDNPSSETTFT